MSEIILSDHFNQENIKNIDKPVVLAKAQQIKVDRSNFDLEIISIFWDYYRSFVSPTNNTNAQPSLDRIEEKGGKKEVELIIKSQQQYYKRAVEIFKLLLDNNRPNGVIRVLHNMQDRDFLLIVKNDNKFMLAYTDPCSKIVCQIMHMCCKKNYFDGLLIIDYSY